MRHIGFAILLLATASASAAQLTAEQRTNLRNACAADIRQLCPGIRPGGGRIAQCVREKSTQLSEGCRTAMGNIAASRSQQQQ